MARLLIPTPDGQGEPVWRNFVWLTLYDPKGRLLYRKKITGTLVLENKSDGRQLSHYASPAGWYSTPVFWAVIGIIANKVIGLLM